MSATDEASASNLGGDPANDSVLDSATLAELIEERKILRDRKTKKLKELVDKTEAEDLVVLGSILESLAEHLTIVDVKILSLLVNSDRAQARKERRDAQGHQDDLKGALNRIRRRIQLIDAKAAADATTSASLNTSMTPAPTSQAFPRRKVETPHFDGDPLKYLEWWGLFRAAVHENAALTVAEKFFELSRCLEGAAGYVVAGTRVTDRQQDYQDVLDELEETFGDPHLLVPLFAQRMISADKAQATAESLRTLLGIFRTSLREIEHVSERMTSTVCKHCQGQGDKRLQMFIAPLLLSKLPPEMASRWKKTAEQQFDVDKLFEFLRKEVQSLTLVDLTTKPAADESKRKQPAAKPKDQQPRRATCLSTQEAAETPAKPRPPRLETFPIGQRLEEAKRRRMCVNCLRRGHEVDNCHSTFRCSKCKGKHHYVLHECLAGPSNSSSSGGNGGGSGTATNISAPLNCAVTLRTTGRKKSWLLSAAVELVAPGRAPVRTRALIDSASEETYVTEALRQAAGAVTERRVALDPEGFGGHRTGPKEYDRVVVNLQGRQGVLHPVHAWVVPKICRKMSGRSLDPGSVPPGIELADDPAEDLEVGVLLGSDCLSALLVADKVVKHAGLVFVPTVFGHAVAGSFASPSASALSLLVQAPSMWELEAMGICPEDDEEPTPQLSITKQDDGRYVTHLPWKGVARPQLDLGQAEARLRSFDRLSESRKEEYTEYLRDQHREGVLREAEDVASFLPHHGVWGKKLRVVLDGSAKGRSKLSINDTLHVGVNLVLPLAKVMLHFREPRNVITADIKGAFLQVAIVEPDRRYLGLLWKDGAQLKQSCFTRLPFGLNCSPWILQAVLGHHLDSGGYDPDLVNAVKEGLYVDDLHLGHDDPQTLVHTAKQAEAVLQDAKMDLHKWKVGGLDVEPGQLPYDSTPGRVLGLPWDPVRDMLQLDVGVVFSGPLETKRELLSQQAKLYDPIGFALPWHIRLRVAFQSLWKLKEGPGSDWDKPLPPDTLKTLEGLKEELREAGGIIEVPRHVGRPAWVDVYVDASPKAYAAAAYVNMGDGQPSKLALARVKLAPIKPELTLPRLELMGALLGVRLYRQFFPRLPVRFWTDSRIVLAWIQGDPGRWKTFVRNRVAEMQDLRERFLWIPGEENPADRGTRGIPLDELRGCALWWEGPAQAAEAPTPSMQESGQTPAHQGEEDERETLAEARRTLVTVGDPAEPALEFPLERYGSLEKAMRVVAVCRRVFVPGEARSLRRRPLTPDELRAGLKLLLQQEQRRFYQEEIADLENGGSVGKGSSLMLLRPTLEDGILVGVARTGERLPLLSSESRLATLIIDHAHALVGHLGAATTAAEVQRQYWIPRLRSRVRHVLHGCVICRRAHGKAFRVPEAHLPDIRRQPCRPFSRVGIDHAGHFQLEEGKAWILLVTCCVTRAVHLEVVGSLSTEATANALRRMQARRGPVEIVVSDNGKSFVALKEALKGLQWKTVPEASPAWNGFTERMVGTVKGVLKKVAQKCGYSWDGFVTLVTVVEEMVNRRPLAQIEDGVITPIHFLLGCPPPPLIPAVFSVEVEGWTPGAAWKRLQATADQFWKDWQAAYLPQLRRWRRSTAASRLPEVGEIVLVEGPTSRNQWPLGRVSELLPGPDGQVRAVKLLIRGRETRRPTDHLIPLEVGRSAVAEEPATGEEEPATEEPPPDGAKGADGGLTLDLPREEQGGPPEDQSGSKEESEAEPSGEGGRPRRRAGVPARYRD